MRKFFYTLVCIIAVAVAVGSTLSLLTDTPNRYLKFLDFPRLQFFWVALASIPLFAVLTRHWRWYDGLLILGLAAAPPSRATTSSTTRASSARASRTPAAKQPPTATQGSRC